MNLNLMFAALSAVFVLNVSLFAQQTPLPQLGITPTQASQHSILERPGQPKLPIAHVAQGPVDKSANETFKDEPSILNIEKAAQETDLLMIDTSVDYDTSDSARTTHNLNYNRPKNSLSVLKALRRSNRTNFKSFNFASPMPKTFLQDLQ